MSTPILQARALSKRFGQLQVTNHVDLAVEAGARLALIGPNGAGKSTLVGLLSGQILPNAGSIHFEGRDITRVSVEKRSRAGLARTFQINNLFRGLTVLENVYLAASQKLGSAGVMWRHAGRSEDVIRRATGLLTDLGLSRDLHRRISEVSYGGQRLVEIAIALALSPKVLLLDEPTAGVPRNEIARIMEVLEALPAELAIVLIEHDMHVVRRFARELVVLSFGSIVARGDPQQVMAREEVRRIYFGGAAGTAEAQAC